jgi:hypothetical protein
MPPIRSIYPYFAHFCLRFFWINYGSALALASGPSVAARRRRLDRLGNPEYLGTFIL